VLEKLIGELRQQWVVIRRAPLPFVLCIAVGASVTWYITTWAYRVRTESLTEHIVTLREQVQTAREQVQTAEGRLKAKDDQIVLERYRYSFATATDEELKRKAREVLQKMSERQRTHDLIEKGLVNLTDAERKSARDAIAQRDQDILSLAIALRDELVSRTAPGKKGVSTDRVGLSWRDYSRPHPSEVISDLVRLSK
jgi:hypothetical protein